MDADSSPVVFKARTADAGRMGARSVIYALLTKREVTEDGWILAKFFFCVFMDRDEVDVHKNAKKNEANIQPS